MGLFKVLFGDDTLFKQTRFQIKDTLSANMNRVRTCQSAILTVYDIASLVKIRNEIHEEIVQRWKDSDGQLDILAVAIAYDRLGASYRKSAIEYYQKFFSSPVPIPYVDDFYKNVEHAPLFYECDLLYSLGLLYEKEYLFENALYAYRKSISYSPRTIGAYIGVGNVLMKTDINKCVSYYKKLIDTNFEKKYGVSLQYKYDEALEKERKGYVYKPKKNKVIDK